VGKRINTKPCIHHFAGKSKRTGVPEMHMKNNTNLFYSKIIKRLIDIILSGLAIVGLSPLLIFLVLWIKLDSPGPVFFKQKRVGREKVLFNILKLRTMRTDAPHDVPTHLLENPESYITRLGRLLRKTSLDELPQIFNIFMGQMSIIGPRPALWNQDDLIAERDKYGVNNIVPGLTGWAQVNGRDELEIDVKAKLDGEYARNIKFSMDWTCFWMTVGNVLKRKGVVEGGTGVMAKQINSRKNDVANSQPTEDKTDACQTKMETVIK